jgi:prolyl-tRNA synthetase
VEGFAPQCAVVTHGGGEKLEEPLYVRPTSETVIWHMYGKWIQSYRDLPLLINQWANVVRWELRTRLFLRTTEFLWQEGHTAHATAEEAEAETRQMLEVYRTFAEEYMAVPVIAGLKTEKEKFAGAERTYSIEAMTQDKRAIQAGTSHNLGQNFAKAFDVTFQNQQGQQEYVYATSWGVSTRLIGALIMMHSDDQGLVLPPKLAPLEVVIVPIWRSDGEAGQVRRVAEEMAAQLRGPVSVKVDDRDNVSPGWKFNEWELKGVPLRCEIGPRDVAQGQTVLARRDTGEKQPVPLTGLAERVRATLDDIQSSLFQRARDFLEANTVRLDTWEEFQRRFPPKEEAGLSPEGEAGLPPEGEEGFVWAHWCRSEVCEAQVQAETKATIRNIPLDREPEAGRCIYCGEPSAGRVVLAKAY